MKNEQVEQICSNLSPLQVYTIKAKILNYKEPRHNVEYTYGEALCFFLADMLTGSKLVGIEQIRLLLEEYVNDIKTFGNLLEKAFLDKDKDKLPTCKIGFLDRIVSCIDSQDVFLNLSTGEKTKGVNLFPLEVIQYSLTALFIRYNRKYEAASSKGKIKP